MFRSDASDGSSSSAAKSYSEHSLQRALRIKSHELHFVNRKMPTSREGLFYKRPLTGGCGHGFTIARRICVSPSALERLRVTDRIWAAFGLAAFSRLARGSCRRSATRRSR